MSLKRSENTLHASKKRKKRHRQKRIITVMLSVGVVVAAVFLIVCMLAGVTSSKKPEDLLVEYMNHIEKKEYEEMYDMIAHETQMPGKDEFMERNSKIYEGIEAKNISIRDIEVGEKKNKIVKVSYTMSFDTIAGEVAFDNVAEFLDTAGDGYKILWQENLIYPGLQAGYKVRVKTSEAERGRILDRNGTLLAGKGVASSVGIVPGKLEDKEEAIPKIADLLGMEISSIEKALEANWVKDDSFVPIATITKIDELDEMSLENQSGVGKEQFDKEKERQRQLLEIPGVMLTDTELRTYSLGEAAAHLIGYVQNVTAEDLEEHAGEGYRSNSVIGRSGMEALFEKELKGQDGQEIQIVNEEGAVKDIMASLPKQDGQDIRLTIDASLQKSLYEQFKEDEGCSVAMNPVTGEVLALVSTPSYDNNDFILGISTADWDALNQAESQPLYNRFRQAWCPGSTFKPIVGAIALENGSVDPDEDFGSEGLSWQKDESWGSYEVTTLKEYTPVIMKNALKYSDNIYFAKTALAMGTEKFEESLDKLGFHEKLPFQIVMTESQYSNEGHISSEIQLADSGYGQGQVLVNPLHMASIYTAFVNEGNMIKPYLEYSEETTPEVWIANAFSAETVDEIRGGLLAVVNESGGTAYSAHRDSISMAGKTGTAELKVDREDTESQEIGWFAVFTADKEAEKPILLISMVENVKGNGGSGYVVDKDMEVLDAYFQ